MSGRSGGRGRWRRASRSAFWRSARGSRRASSWSRRRPSAVSANVRSAAAGRRRDGRVAPERQRAVDELVRRRPASFAAPLVGVERVGRRPRSWRRSSGRAGSTCRASAPRSSRRRWAGRRAAGPSSSAIQVQESVSMRRLRARSMPGDLDDRRLHHPRPLVERRVLEDRLDERPDRVVRAAGRALRAPPRSRRRRRRDEVGPELADEEAGVARVLAGRAGRSRCQSKLPFSPKIVFVPASWRFGSKRKLTSPMPSSQSLVQPVSARACSRTSSSV